MNMFILKDELYSIIYPQYLSIGTGRITFGCDFNIKKKRRFELNINIFFDIDDPELSSFVLYCNLDRHNKTTRFLFLNSKKEYKMPSTHFTIEFVIYSDYKMIETLPFKNYLSIGNELYISNEYFHKNISSYIIGKELIEMISKMHYSENINDICKENLSTYITEFEYFAFKIHDKFSKHYFAISGNKELVVSI